MLVWCQTSVSQNHSGNVSLPGNVSDMVKRLSDSMRRVPNAEIVRHIIAYHEIAK